MDVQDFLPRIQAAGFALETDGADIIVRPFSRLSESQKAFIRTHKPELIAALTGRTTAQPAATETYQASPADLATVADWLDAIGESPEGIAATLDRCKAEPAALEFFLGLARKPAKPQEDVRNCQAPSPTPVPSRAPRPATESPAVCCGNCGNFIRDRIGDGTGLGSCPTVNPPGLLWPGTVRRCQSFEAVEAAGLNQDTSNTLETAP